MSLAQRMHFLQDMFQMTAMPLVTVINHYYINCLQSKGLSGVNSR